MTLVNFVVRNFQSLHEVDIALEPFTVIVGATSSGKSAFTRALRTFIANQRGTAFISHGEQSTFLRGTTDTGAVITLTRGRSSAHDAYLVAQGDQVQRFTKLGGTIPPEVSEVIGIDPKDPLTFASQFDRPYLLADSPAEVARTFGALTNVGMIMAASRESKRQRGVASQTLKTRTEDAEHLRESIPKFRTLGQQIRHQNNAEALIDKARHTESQIARLSQLLGTIEAANSVLEQHLEQHPLPVLDALEAAAQRALRARALVMQMRTAVVVQREASGTVVSTLNQVGALEAQYTQTLIEAHTCPTCGASTEHLHEQAH